mmetsp:Transcript_45237/g.96644  ORF Transcript_45237/g.96644 Transcript_45237/m.96644 type:complete len:230 (+) Transcript_45237:267-956(+)
MLALNVAEQALEVHHRLLSDGVPHLDQFLQEELELDWSVIPAQVPQHIYNIPSRDLAGYSALLGLLRILQVMSQLRSIDGTITICVDGTEELPQMHLELLSLLFRIRHFEFRLLSGSGADHVFTDHRGQNGHQRPGACDHEEDETKLDCGDLPHYAVNGKGLVIGLGPINDSKQHEHAVWHRAKRREDDLIDSVQVLAKDDAMANEARGKDCAGIEQHKGEHKGPEDAL